MHPTLITLFGWSIPTFGVLVALGFGLGLLWAARRARAVGVDPGAVLELTSWVMLVGLIGARLTYAVFFPQVFFADPIGTLLNPGGLVWYGGVIAVFLVLPWLTRRQGLSFWQFGDLLAPPAALGLALGRLGCLMAGCCYGSASLLPWAIHYPASHPTHGLAVHPTPVYESLAALVLALLLARLPLGRWPAGGVLGLFLVGYGIIRFALEALRGDRLVWLTAWDLSASQVISLVGVGLGLMLLVWRLGQPPVSPQRSQP